MEKLKELIYDLRIKMYCTRWYSKLSWQLSRLFELKCDIYWKLGMRDRANHLRSIRYGIYDETPEYFPHED